MHDKPGFFLTYNVLLEENYEADLNQSVVSPEGGAQENVEQKGEEVKEDVLIRKIKFNECPEDEDEKEYWLKSRKWIILNTEYDKCLLAPYHDQKALYLSSQADFNDLKEMDEGDRKYH